MSEQSVPEEPMTADVFRRTPASTQRVTPRPVPVDPPAKSSAAAPAAPPAAESAESPAPSMDAGPPAPAVADQQPLGPVPPAVVPSRAAAAPDPMLGESPPPGPPGYPQQPPQVFAGLAADQQPAPQARPEQAAYPAPPQEPLPYPAPQQQEPVPAPYSFDNYRQSTQQAVPASPAQWGWRGRVRRLTGGLISPAMGRAEAAHRAATEQVQGHLQGPKTVVMINPKGGAGTTTATLMAARTFGVLRGGSVIAWDNNETRGTLGQRGRPVGHWNTARELLDNIYLFADSSTARIGDLGLYVRGQGPAHFDLLASDERPEVTGHIDRNEVGELHRLFQRFYKLILIDTGNNIRAANFLAAVHSADLLVVTATVRRDTANAAVWMLDALEREATGLGLLKRKTVTVLADLAPHNDPALKREMDALFSARTRAVHSIPYDPALADGGVVNYDRLSPATHNAWLFACASMASILQEQQ